MSNRFLKPSFLSILFLLTVIFLNGCKEDQRAKPLPPAATSYVYAYTSGTISKVAPIRVRFTQALVAESAIGSEVDKGVIDFKPDLEGKARWENDHTLIVEPIEPLKTNTSYLATVKLSQLFSDLPREAAYFEFNFRTREQNFEVNTLGLEAASATDMVNQSYKGNIFTADVANQEEVEKLLTAKMNGQSLPIRWVHKGDGQNHEFFVSDIQRTNQGQELDLSWNGRSLNVDKKDQRKIAVPSLGNFKVMDARVIQDQGQYVLVQFSDPLSPGQNLKGMVQISGYKGDLKYTIDGNELRVYPSGRIAGNRKITINTGIRNIKKLGMKNKGDWSLSFIEAKPQVRLAGRGVILPNSDGLIFPFEAINLKAVDVEIFKIYSNNILQFLQTNKLDGRNYMEQVGRVVSQHKVDLSALNANTNTVSWNRYALDLATMVGKDPNAIYQVRIGFKPSYSSYFCSGASKDADANLTLSENTFDESGDIRSIYEVGYYGPDGYYDGYRWEHRKDPCYPAYFNSDRIVARNVLASNIGMIAKGSDNNQLLIAVTDIRTTDPLAGIELTFYDFQQQLIKTVTSDQQGIAAVDLERTPFVVVAKRGEETGYLKLADGHSLSLSKFDVAGTVAQKGLKGYIYGERGVWRPGDSIYLNFVLEDKTGQLPADHPITTEIYDARNQLYKKWTSSKNVNRIYPLALATAMDDPTGNWRAQIKVGSASFSKTLKVETVKPNRLKIKVGLDPKQAIAVSDLPKNTELQVNWLHGAPARNLKTKVDVQLKTAATKFPKFKDYVFKDPARSYAAEGKTVFDGQVDNDGKANLKLDLARNNNNMPGKMRASFKIRAFEKGGDFSEDNFSVAYDPFESYTGISIPKNRYGSKRFDVDKEGTVDLALVDKEGQPMANRQLSVGLYRVEWRWWWERSNNNISSYNSSKHLNAQKKGTINTNSKGEARWAVKVPRWGRYMVRVCDENSGHCSGDFFYAGYPWYDSDDDNNQRNREAASMLAFSADKEKYKTGETIELRIPTADIGRALITIENGSGVVESYWQDCKKGETNFEFYATPEMAPTVYAHVTLLQPHAQVKNDLPIRMYGVIPIHVEDPKTRLEPVVNMPAVLEPEQKVKVEVAEKNGRPMAYTIAMVDEGLLDLTRFKTPNPWKSFYAREALGVKTWDVFDHVLGAYGGQMDRLLGVGGDGELENSDAGKKANRFEPVVRHLGPFFLGKGKKASHEITMPNYVGSVRTMVVAVDNGAYGHTDKTTPVRKPLMVLATLPRVLGPGEQLTLPVNVFAMEDKVKDVTIKVEESTGLVEFPGGMQKSLRFNRPGDEIVEFDLRVREQVGVARFKVTATGGGETAVQEIEIDIRNPNPMATDILAEVLEAGTIWEKSFDPLGVQGTNDAVLEISSIPPMNLDKRLKYLLRYPHGCVEQTTSSVFPQLFVDRLLELEEAQKQKMTNNITAGINRLRKFQTSSGGLGYWPGDDSNNHWGTNYAGHFILEAKKLGYDVSDTFLDNWKRFQKRAAKNWDPETNDGYSRRGLELTQAYRLYTLALAGEPEMGAMNRLRESKGLTSTARYRLAAAYALAGQKEVASQLTQNVSSKVDRYNELSYTYGSDLRDQAMMLETMVLMGDKKSAGDLAKTISDRLSANNWYSTQTTAYSLLAIGKLVGNTTADNKIQFAYQLNGGAAVNAGSSKPVKQISIPMTDLNAKSVKITNQGKNLLYARLIIRGQPMVGDQSVANNHLKLQVSYKKLDGSKLDPSNLQQGTDFVAEVQIINPGTKNNWYDEMALSQVFPSGWEILNTRLSGVQSFSNISPSDYQDVRDDRVYTYFDIGKNKARTYRVQLNAAYRGRYYLPSVTCDAMYDNTINARQPGQWVEVVEPKEL